MSLQSEQEKYGDVWALPAYHAHSPGAQRVPLLVEMLDTRIGIRPAGVFVVDAGCGAGAGALALSQAGFPISALVDLVDVRSDEVIEKGWPFYAQPLWQKHRNILDADLAYCCDVMEHIPPQFTGLVIARLLEMAPRVFLSISFEPDNFGVWVGQPLHLTVESFDWWKELLGTLGRIVEARDMIGQGVFLVERAR